MLLIGLGAYFLPFSAKEPRGIEDVTKSRPIREYGVAETKTRDMRELWRCQSSSDKTGEREMRTLFVSPNVRIKK
jgi:hypothetical protein